MKKILVLMHYMELGGAESAFLGLLQAHNPSRAQMDVFIYDHRGALLPYIPLDKVNLLPIIPSYTVLERPITELLRRGFGGIAFARMLGRWKAKRYSTNNIHNLDDISGFSFQQRETVRLLPKVNPDVEYDLAISFHFPHYIVAQKVRAKKKLGWIHNDYSHLFFHPTMETRMWSSLDFIASISEEVGIQFASVLPSLAKKVIPIENIISSRFVLQRAQAFVPEDMLRTENSINLLSIGRFCYQKRFDEIGLIASLMKPHLDLSGTSFHWYLIGYGGEEDTHKIHQGINQFGMQDHVTVLGKRDNPCPYIKACDLYVQPSRYEGKSITVREAQIIGKPVAVSAYDTANSQIQDGVDGVILPMNAIEFARGLAGFINNEPMRNEIISYLRCHDYGNESEIEKIYKLIDL